MIGVKRTINICPHSEVTHTKHPAVWICKMCNAEFVPKYFWDAEYIKHNELLTEVQMWADLGRHHGIGGKLFYNKVRALLKQEQEMKVYIIGGWFSKEQEVAVAEIENVLKDKERFNVYSPRKEMLYEPGSDVDPHRVLHENVLAIERSDACFASTEGKDMGSLFECGYAYSLGIPIIYYYKHAGNFNLMLSGSAKAVVTSYKDLQNYVDELERTGRLPDQAWLGEVE